MVDESHQEGTASYFGKPGVQMSRLLDHEEIRLKISEEAHYCARVRAPLDSEFRGQ